MNKYQEAYERLSKRTFKHYKTFDEVFDDIDTLGELVEKETTKKAVFDDLKEIEKKFNALGYIKMSRGRVNVYKREDGNRIPSNKTILIYPDGIAWFWESADILHPCTMKEKETELALAELKAQDWSSKGYEY